MPSTDGQNKGTKGRRNCERCWRRWWWPKSIHSIWWQRPKIWLKCTKDTRTFHSGYTNTFRSIANPSRPLSPRSHFVRTMLPHLHVNMDDAHSVTHTQTHTVFHAEMSALNSGILFPLPEQVITFMKKTQREKQEKKIGFHVNLIICDVSNFVAAAAIALSSRAHDTSTLFFFPSSSCSSDDCDEMIHILTGWNHSDCTQIIFTSRTVHFIYLNFVLYSLEWNAAALCGERVQLRRPDAGTAESRYKIDQNMYRTYRSLTISVCVFRPHICRVKNISTRFFRS